jgi:tetratricopeptide (TPR) repeat protein
MRRAKDGLCKLRGGEHALVLKCRHNEALIKQSQQKYQEAVELYKELLQDRQRLLGSENIDTLKTALNLGLALYQTSQYEEAVPLMRKTLSCLERVAGPSHPFALSCMMNLSLALSKQHPGDEEAIRLAHLAADEQFLIHGSEMEETWIAWRDLALVLKEAKQLGAAEESMRRALHGHQKKFGLYHVKTRQILQYLCDILDTIHGSSDMSNELRKECAAQTVTKVSEASTPQERGPKVAFIMNVYITPEHRRAGNGKAVVDHLKAQAKKASAESMQVLAKSTSPSVNFFLDQCGMIKVCERSLQRPGVIYADLHLAL